MLDVCPAFITPESTGARTRNKLGFEIMTSRFEIMRFSMMMVLY